MSNIIEEFYYGNIEPQEVNSELTPKLKKKLSNLAEKEEQLTARLAGEDKELFQNYVSAYIEYSTKVMLTALYQVSDLAQDLHTTHLLRIRKDEYYYEKQYKYSIQTGWRLQHTEPYLTTRRSKYQARKMGYVT